MPSRSEVKVILLNHNVTHDPNTLLFPILPLASDFGFYCRSWWGSSDPIGTFQDGR